MEEKEKEKWREWEEKNDFLQYENIYIKKQIQQILEFNFFDFYKYLKNKISN